MQVHGPSETIDQVGVYLNPGASTSRPFVVLTIGSVEVFIYTAAEADQLAAAVAEAKRLLGEPEGGAS